MHKKIKVTIPEGLHARPCGKIAQIITESNAKVFITYNEKKADASSILEMLELNIPFGSLLSIEIFSKDEEALLNQIEKIISYP